MGRIVRVTLTLALLGAMQLLDPDTAAATTGPYTFPFFNPDVVQTQAFGCTGFGGEPPYNGCAHYHIGIDYALGGNSFAIAAADAGEVVVIVQGHGTGVCPQPGDPVIEGNYVVIQHGTGSSAVYTIYYHLLQNSVIPGMHAQVSAGQKIATAGNSGSACGIHLHYMYTKSTDPNNQAAAMNPAGHWTTSSGAVPWLSQLVAQSNNGTIHIVIGTNRASWVQFKNIGGRTWKQTQDANGLGKVVLYSTDSGGDDTSPSLFQGPDWSTATLVTFADQTSVLPGDVGSFSFGLLPGNQTNPGQSYTNYFNIRAYGLWWFSYDSDHNNSYHVPIVVDASCQTGC